MDKLTSQNMMSVDGEGISGRHSKKEGTRITRESNRKKVMLETFLERRKSEMDELSQ